MSRSTTRPPLAHAGAATPLSAPDRQAVLAIASALAPLEAGAFDPLLQAITVQQLPAGDTLLRAGEPGAREFFVLDGVLRSWVGDAAGREVTLAFHVGPGVLTPAIGRVVDGCSRVHCQALTAVRVAGFEASALVACMLRDPTVQRWGDAVLRAELMRRADREWALAALPAAQRLQQFRQQFPGLEARIAQHHIASYLGITPVSLSRLRAQERAASGRPGRSAGRA
ncbi:Crp/Fnr family transcriptional regulator [Aquincola sp. S2]|uniref:Crp/Fnr family transcriptional regulator n=1 Tax=Pseudaquabacterium terrae TaxID=2732868 RepID=A0ABX2ENT4_9BURK|nr:Crp/Fnr family transcriptional regulator [Aquabacterium terrae]NRF70283.1 Crp/Fnr family transcriptional regulator [Aquabacterium terrae]